MKAIQFSSLKLECETRTLSNDDGNQVVLRPLPYEVLVFLLLKGAPASREELFEKCWGGAVVTDQALTNVISGLRRHFHMLSAKEINIQTISKVGYFLDVEVKIIEALEPVQTSEDIADVEPIPVEAPPQASLESVEHTSKQGLHFKAFYVLVFALLAIIASTFIFEPFKPRSPFADSSQYVRLLEGEPAFYFVDGTNGMVDKTFLTAQLRKASFTHCAVDAYIRVFPSIYEPNVIAMTVRLKSQNSPHSHVFQHFNVKNLTMAESVLMAFDNWEVRCELQ